ncbi:YjbF family lipoprotein [Rubellimicrobium mesophilum]|nr:YjbF family lipoprotein [Rubellimicrobium mesophilum]
MRRTFLGAAALLALAACGQETGPGNAGTDGVNVPAAESRALGIVGQARSIFGGVGSDDSVHASRSIPGGFTPEAIAAEPGTYRLVQINALGLQEPARVIQENGPEITLALQSGPTAAFDGGVLVATRGFGDDLITMESAGVLQALRSGGGTVTRRMETLDAQNQILTDSFACTIAPAGAEAVNLGIREATLRRFNENCRGTALIFDNIYWLDDSGSIVSSRQYVSPTVAYLRSNRL